MEFLNRIELRGFVGNVRKQKTSDRWMVNFSLATDYSLINANSCAIVETTWHNVVAWSSDTCPELGQIEKGSAVYVEGRLRTQRYTDAHGINRLAHDVVASTVRIV